MNILRLFFIIDLWGIGCEGCAQFHKMFEKDIWPTVKDVSDFKVVSVNIDKTKDRWLKGIGSNHYTSMDYINLYTGENVGTQNHDFTKFYNVNAVPFLVLVGKDGRIIAKFDNGLDSKSLLKLIFNGLSSPYHSD